MSETKDPKDYLKLAEEAEEKGRDIEVFVEKLRRDPANYLTTHESLDRDQDEADWYMTLAFVVRELDRKYREACEANESLIATDESLLEWVARLREELEKKDEALRESYRWIERVKMDIENRRRSVADQGWRNWLDAIQYRLEKASALLSPGEARPDMRPDEEKSFCELTHEAEVARLRVGLQGLANEAVQEFGAGTTSDFIVQRVNAALSPKEAPRKEQ